MPRSRVTIRDVAARAGVSHQTVSRVINRSERVNTETRERVEAAIAELGYYPNAVARSMARGRTCMLGCLAPNLTDFTFANIIEGAETEARKQGFFLVSSSTPDEDTFSVLIEELAGSRRIEGLMVINPYMDGRHALLPEKFPSVFVGARPRDEAVNSVALDDHGAACDATRHLIELGHQRIAMITGPMIEDCSQDRCQGFQDALRGASLAYDPGLVAVGDWSASSGYLAFQQLASRAALPSAIFAQNDRMAVGVIQAAREMGIDVPGDLSVIGVDDMPLASYFDPPLSTMRQDTQVIGREAARLLIRAVEEPECSYQHLLVSAELIPRASTGPVREVRR
ncbi:MAG: LacI family DNA-binding transcriptional regulator [Anaerolineales bacterium]|nr:LacI family DNA-binding transcriptional regulator [Anaerolineales bacterium]